jgi:putative membrane protein
MTEYGFFTSNWWIFPLLMIVVCMIFMRKGCGRMMCEPGAQKTSGESAQNILNKRYAEGDIDQKEYKERKRELTRS